MGVVKLGEKRGDLSEKWKIMDGIEGIGRKMETLGGNLRKE